MEISVTRRLRALGVGVSVALLGAAGAVGSSAAAAAQPATQLCLASATSALDSPAKTEAFNLETSRLRQSGVTEKEVDEFIRTRYNLVRVSGTPKVESATINSVSSLRVPAPSIYRDTCTGRYTVTATWQFVDIDGIDDGHPFGCPRGCDVAGEDGFGMALSRNVASVSSYSMVTCGWASSPSPQFGCSSGRMHLEDSGADGAGYAGLDRMQYSGACCRVDYSFWWGQLVMGINSPGCGSLQAFAKYGHTWNSTNVNVSVSYPLNVGLSFSSTSHRWQLASQPSNSVTPC